MPLQKIKRKIKSGDFDRFRFINLIIAAVCVLVCYLIAVVSDSAQEAFQEFKEIKSIVQDVGETKSIDELKKKVRDNPEILKKVNSSMIDKFKSNPLFKKRIEKELRELE